MLRRLSVENYALIDKLEMELDPHLNIITGETGAGKSILLGALGLLLGNKNDGLVMKDATKSCVVEGVFDLSGHRIESFFEQNDIDYATQTTVTRMITSAGKSRAFINDIPVQLAQLKEFGSQFIDIHSQHQNLILSSEDFRINAVDTVAENAALLEKYSGLFTQLATLRRTLSALTEAAAAGHKDEEWLRYQVDELSAAKLREGEQAELEQEQSLLANADRIGEVLTGIRNAFDEEEFGVLLRLKLAETELNHVRETYPQATEMAERLRSVLLELKDINATITDDSQRIESDPERLQTINNRLDTIYSLCHKHHVEQLEELIAVRDKYTAQLNAITHSDEQLEAVQAEIATVTAQAELLAGKLHKARAAAAPAFEKQILATLLRLGMPDTVFKIGLTDCGLLTRTGRDAVDFLFTANRNTTPQPVEKIASGGEMSRVMLALKALLAQRMQLPTIIFDEIDAGVSGRIADAMGGIICALAEHMQVVDITHLPQVASKGETHFVVYKQAGQTLITRLTPQARIAEIAKMLSGSVVTDAAVSQAKILLGAE
ncbi:MAG: DNA repair protein RecN [Alistipes sp.]